MAQQKIPTYEEKYEELLALVKEGKIADAVQGTRLWENEIENAFFETRKTKGKEIVALIQEGKFAEAREADKRWKNNKLESHLDKGKMLWELGKYCEEQDKLSEAFEFYRHIDSGNYRKQANQQVWKIASWYLYLDDRQEVKLKPIDRLNYAQLSGSTAWLNNVDEWLAQETRFREEAYLPDRSRPNFSKSLDQIKNFLGLDATKAIYASPLSNSSNSMTPIATAVTTTTATAQQQDAPQSYRLS